MKNVELDLVCRVCLTVKKEMRNLFGESVVEMLEEISNRIKVKKEDGWPDKICIQCVHQVSRAIAFKKRLESADEQLRNYIEGLTVVIPDPLKEEPEKTHPLQQQRIIAQPQQIPQQMQEIQIRSDHQPTLHQQPLILMNGLNNNQAQIINGQIITTANGQQLIQTSNGQLIQTSSPIGQFLQGPNNTIQMITQNNGASQVLQLRTGDDDRCVIVQPDLNDTQYYEDVVVSSANGQQTIQILPHHQVQQLQQQVQQQQQQQHQQQQHQQQHHQQQQQLQQVQQISQEQEAEMLESDEIELHEVTEEYEDDEYSIAQCDQIEEEIELEEGQLMDQDNEETYIVETIEELVEEADDQDEKQILAEFLQAQTRCEGPGKHICNLCRKEFKHQKWLHSHMKSHINWIKANCKKQPQCELCGKSFRGPGMLRMHMKTHEKENKLPTCTICGKEFKTKSILYRHRQTHFDQKQFSCSICDKTFSSNYQLNAHMARHRGDRKYNCNHCDAKFYNASELKTHVQQHLGIPVKSAREPSKRVIIRTTPQ
ncbi:unnamed protein product [Diamesa serratosioi]